MRFENPWPGSVDHSFKEFLKWQRERRRDQRPDPPPSVFVRATPAFYASRAGNDTLAATWIGHASVLLQVGSVNILTDPIWSHRASPVSFIGPTRWVPPGVPFEALPPIDLVLISHNHYDHLDAPTVRRLIARAPEARWVAPAGVEPWLRKAGARHVSDHRWWDVLDHEGIDIGCVPARHFSARTPFDRNRTWWCGWTVAVHGWAVYFAGDTGYHPEFGAIASRRGPFDLVLLPIGAYEPRWFMGQIHMDPDDALRAYGDLRGAGSDSALLPIHWGTFRLTDEPMDEPPRRLAEAWHAGGLEPEKLWLLRHGETRRLSRAV